MGRFGNLVLLAWGGDGWEKGSDEKSVLRGVKSKGAQGYVA